VSGSKTADVIVIGGGVAGLSTAMQLGKRGNDVVVLERDRLGCGSTGRGELEQLADLEIYVQTGSLRVAGTPERAEEIAELVQMGKSIGLEIHHLPIDGVAARLPYMKTDDLLDACYCPTDGHLQPTELVNAYVTIGTGNGVRYEVGCSIDQIMLEHQQVKGVRTSKGEFFAPVVVNAAGPWSYLVADLAETVLPTAALRHHYLTVEPDADCPVDRLSPAVRDRHLRIYSRPERGKLIVGMYGAEPVGCEMQDLPRDFDMSAMKVERNDRYDIDAIEADRYFDVPAYRDRREIRSKCHEMYAGYYGRVERP